MWVESVMLGAARIVKNDASTAAGKDLPKNAWPVLAFPWHWWQRAHSFIHFFIFSVLFVSIRARPTSRRSSTSSLTFAADSLTLADLPHE
jgi:hypothetical protein